ncbi:hypothetical protein [Massilia antarctica]|uniref:hypothetical protein n=1 Tax=Massilia antarctica TaxID=2765360 RepID=UPI002271BCE4|nr:hypothetical protein [Massilia sp. H27-R4]
MAKPTMVVIAPCHELKSIMRILASTAVFDKKQCTCRAQNCSAHSICAPPRDRATMRCAKATKEPEQDAALLYFWSL